MLQHNVIAAPTSQFLANSPFPRYHSFAAVTAFPTAHNPAPATTSCVKDRQMLAAAMTTLQATLFFVRGIR